MQEVNHGSRGHALLSASGSSKWLNCTVSAFLEKKFAESKTSVFAEEGTLAHEFAQINLQLHFGFMTPKVHGVEIKKLRKHKLYTDEMEGQVAKFTDYVIETFNIVKQECPDAIILIEEHLDYSYLVESGYGTGDICILADGVLYVIDLKYGKGVQVFAEENSQLKLYGLGAHRKYEMSYDIKTLALVIVQPRLDHIDRWDAIVEDVLDWGENFVRPRAALAIKGEGQQVAGSHCKWCKAKPMCRAFAEMNQNLARYDFRDPHTLSESELLGIYEQIPMLTDWASSVASYLLDQAIKGKKWPGYKVVEGKSNRSWANQPAVMKILEEKAFVKEAYTKEELLGIPAIEKLVGKEDFNKLIAPFVLKPQGKSTLAQESDRRPELGSTEAAQNDFK